MDIGQSGVKIAQLSRSGKNWTLEEFAIAPLKEGVMVEDEAADEEELKNTVSDALANTAIKTKGVCFGLSGPNTVSRKIQLAGGTKEEIEDQVVWEAEQYLPFPIDEANVDFHILGENEGGGVDVVLGAIRKDTIEPLVQILTEMGLFVKIVDLNVLALTNLFEIVGGEEIKKSDGTFLLLDIGAQKTQFIIYKKKALTFSKEVSVGGAVITEEIQRRQGLNFQEAEDLKIFGDGNGNLPVEVMQVIDDIVEAFFTEIKKTLDFYISSTSDDAFVKCFITGGSARIPGLLDGLSALLSIPVEILNPFDVIGYDEANFDEEMLNEIAFRGCTAIGLALRDGDE